MPRVGWAAAEVVGTDPPEWYQVSAWHDGWVEIPYLARSVSDARADLARFVEIFAVVGVGFGLAALIGHVVQDSSAPYLAILPALIVVASILYAVFWMSRQQRRDRVQRVGDAGQYVAMRDSGRLPRRRPGIKLFAIMRSAQEYADSFTNIRLTLGADITSVELGRDAADYIATVHLADSSQRTYRSPDKKLHTVVGHFARSDRMGI